MPRSPPSGPAGPAPAATGGHRTGLKHLRHPVVGDLHLAYDVMELPADPGLTLIALSAEAGSPDDDALRLLASWAATHEPADAMTAPHQT